MSRSIRTRRVQMIYLGADHQGYNLKEKIKAFLKSQNFEYQDFGAYELEKQDDYPDFAKIVCQEVLHDGLVNFGILICATGIGMSIAANKFKNIHAALCCTPEMAKSAREHNNANVLCLGKDAEYKEIVKVFLESKFEGEERHVRRIKKIFNF